MKIIKKSPGEYIPYNVSGTRITFDSFLTFDLLQVFGRNAVHIDICYDSNGALVIGAAAGRFYAAEIDIPAAKESDTTLNMDNVTLSLWAIDSIKPVEVEEEASQEIEEIVNTEGGTDDVEL